jgi:transposase
MLKRTVIEQAIMGKMSTAQAAGLLGMHPKAFLRLKSRYRKEGDAALWPRKPGPKPGSREPANKTAEGVEDLVLELSRRFPWLGPAPLAEKVAGHGFTLHSTTVWRILRRRTDRYARPSKRWREDPKLYALEDPGIEVQADGCFPYGRARRLCAIDGVDDCSRFLCADVYEGEDMPSMKLFIVKLLRESPFRVRAIRLDNRFNGREMREFCADLGVRVIFNEPHRPESNGKIERYHRTFKRECVWRTVSFHDPIETVRYKVALWVRHYNYERRHTGLGMDGLTPAQKVASVYLSRSIHYPHLVTGTLQQYKS